MDKDFWSYLEVGARGSENAGLVDRSQRRNRSSVKRLRLDGGADGGWVHPPFA